MATFKDLKGVEGIDKLNECIPLLNEIFDDKEIFNEQDERTFTELATPIYKKHTDAINKLFEILEINPDSSIGILTAITTLLYEISQDKEIAVFFMGTSPSLRRMIYATANTEGEQ